MVDSNNFIQFFYSSVSFAVVVILCFHLVNMYYVWKNGKDWFTNIVIRPGSLESRRLKPFQSKVGVTIASALLVGSLLNLAASLYRVLHISDHFFRYTTVIGAPICIVLVLLVSYAAVKRTYAVQPPKKHPKDTKWGSL